MPCDRMQLASFSAALFAVGVEAVLGVAAAPHAAISNAQQMAGNTPEYARMVDAKCRSGAVTEA